MTAPVGPEERVNASPGQQKPIDRSETKRYLRFIFVQMLFALTITEIARLLGVLFSQGLDLGQMGPALTHLLLAGLIVTSSWVGWSNSAAHHRVPDVENVFSWPFLVLLTDLGLVMCYFILVKGAEVQSNAAVGAPASAREESIWCMVIFGGYVFWDILTKLTRSDRVRGLGKRFSAYFVRGWVTLLCLGMSILIFCLLRGVKGRTQVILTDVALGFTIILFRLGKQYFDLHKWREWKTVTCCVGLVLLFGIPVLVYCTKWYAL